MAELYGYDDLYEIMDGNRKNKYLSLLIMSLKKDLKEWKQQVSTTTIFYISPTYEGNVFYVEYNLNYIIAFVRHESNRRKELISSNFAIEYSDLFKSLCSNIFSSDINEIEKILNEK